MLEIMAVQAVLEALKMPPLTLDYRKGFHLCPHQLADSSCNLHWQLMNVVVQTYDMVREKSV